MRGMTMAAMASIAALSGCASIVGGANQSVSVETIRAGAPLAGATCELTNDKGKWFVTSPGTVTVHRAYGDMSVKCSKDGAEPGIMTVKSSTKGMAFGNILFGGIIGAGIDMGTGAAYDYPPLITVSMGLTTMIAPPAKPAEAALPRDATSAAWVTTSAPAGVTQK